MKFELVVRPKAEEDIAQSAIWYEGKVRGLGINFIEALDSVLTVIQANPTAYQKRYKELEWPNSKGFLSVSTTQSSHQK